MRLAWNQFRRVFGFAPALGINCQIVLDAEQKLVDKVLSGLASAFSDAAKVENALQADLKGTDEPEAVLHLRDQAVGAHQRLLATKGAFWHAYKLAKEAHFVMRVQYTDYLPSPYR